MHYQWQTKLGSEPYPTLAIIKPDEDKWVTKRYPQTRANFYLLGGVVTCFGT